MEEAISKALFNKILTKGDWNHTQQQHANRAFETIEKAKSILEHHYLSAQMHDKFSASTLKEEQEPHDAAFDKVFLSHHYPGQDNPFEVASYHERHLLHRTAYECHFWGFVRTLHATIDSLPFLANFIIGIDADPKSYERFNTGQLNEHLQQSPSCWASAWIENHKKWKKEEIRVALDKICNTSKHRFLAGLTPRGYLVPTPAIQLNPIYGGLDVTKPNNETLKANEFMELAYNSLMVKHYELLKQLMELAKAHYEIASSSQIPRQP